jgi:hypothetical protein
MDAPTSAAAAGGWQRARRWVAFASASAIAIAATARAHVVYGAPSLYQLMAGADRVVRARIVEPQALLILEEPALRERIVVAQVLETLEGAPLADEGDTLRFVQHGHGVPEYATGEEVALFLQRIERSRELGRSALVGRVAWVSIQEGGAKFTLDGETGDAFVEALRRYADLEGMASAEARRAALRRLTLELLGSPDARLASSALRDVVLAPEATPLLIPEDLSALELLLHSPDVRIGVRVGLLAELERRGLMEGPSRWADLLRTTAGSDRIAVVRASAAHPSQAVTHELIQLLGSPDREVAAAAAVALGAPGNAAAVAPLTVLLEDPESRVRMAAIRGLGRVATNSARQALEAAAASHPDAATRRRAAAEVTRLTRQPS